MKDMKELEQNVYKNLKPGEEVIGMFLGLPTYKQRLAFASFGLLGYLFMGEKYFQYYIVVVTENGLQLNYCKFTTTKDFKKSKFISFNEILDCKTRKESKRLIPYKITTTSKEVFEFDAAKKAVEGIPTITTDLVDIISSKLWEKRG